MNYDPNFNDSDINLSGIVVRKHGGSKTFIIAAALTLFGALLSFVLDVILAAIAFKGSEDLYERLGLIPDVLISILSLGISVVVFIGLYRFYLFCNGMREDSNGLRLVVTTIGVSYALSFIQSIFSLIKETQGAVNALSIVLSAGLTGWLLYYVFKKISSSVDYVYSSLDGKPTGKISRVVLFLTRATFVLFVLLVVLCLFTRSGLNVILEYETDPNLIALANDSIELFNQLLYIIAAMLPTAIANLLFSRLIVKFRNDMP
ncbi:MAG: hypothetical protein IKK70_00270 [Clostridia bacterium]|nr:hypothetical protein [Clostridia bacterium]